MTLPLEFLRLSQFILDGMIVQPTQAGLRRAISTAYYALFHLLLQSGAEAAAPPQPQELRDFVRRAFTHADMLVTCRAILRGQAPKPMSNPPPAEIESIAATFEELQSARIIADYDLTKSFTIEDAEALIASAAQAFELWSTIKQSPDANVFLLAMLLGKRWSRP